MNVFLVFHHLQNDKQRKQRHSLKLGKKRRESSKRYYYIISPRVKIKAIIIKSAQIPTSEQLLWAHRWGFCATHLFLPNLLSPLGTPRPCLLTVSKIYTICRDSLIVTTSSRLPQKQFTKKDTGWKLYSVSRLLLTGIVTSILIWHCFDYIVRNILVALLEALCARKFCLDSFFLNLYPMPPSPPDLPGCRFLETLLVDTACSFYFLCQAWQTWACFLAFVQHACCHTGASRWTGGQPYLLLPFLRSMHCWCGCVFQPPDCLCSHLGPLELFCTANTLCLLRQIIAHRTRRKLLDLSCRA